MKGKNYERRSRVGVQTQDNKGKNYERRSRAGIQKQDNKEEKL